MAANWLTICSSSEVPRLAAIARILPITATKNLEGETVGLANRAFAVIYPARNPFRRFKKAHRGLYYAVKYATLVAVAALALTGGYLVLR